MAKVLRELVKIQLPAGGATPAPPVGSILGQRGLNIQDFCKKFNDLTKDAEKNSPHTALVSVYEDKSFKLAIKSPPASWFLKKAAKLDKGSATTGRDFVGRVSLAQCRTIAEAKLADLNTTDADKGAKIIAATARSMGLEVQE